jgi:hypothetical protein
MRNGAANVSSRSSRSVEAGVATDYDKTTWSIADGL